jgi:K(+)-stimulated pyrophosphate-energized sodium pump
MKSRVLIPSFSRSSWQFFYAHDWKLAALTTIGVALAVAFNPLTSYFTSTKSAPVKEIVEATKTGPATTILSGLSLGMESSVYALVVIVVAFIGALLLYGGPNPFGTISGDNLIYVLYGVAMVGIGMLSHTGNNVAMDSYGPISDNANGIGEMAWHDENDEETKAARQIMPTWMLLAIQPKPSPRVLPSPPRSLLQ